MDLEEKPKVKIKDENLTEINDVNKKLEFMIVNKSPLKNIIKSNELNNKINLTIHFWFFFSLIIFIKYYYIIYKIIFIYK